MVILMVSAAMSAWAARVWLSEPSCGAVAFACALVVFQFSVLRFREGFRLASLAAREEWFERSGGGRIRL